MNTLSMHVMANFEGFFALAVSAGSTVCLGENGTFD